MKITQEDFEAWLASPVTEAVHGALEKFAKRAELTWLQVSWHGDKVDPLQQRDLKARASVAMDLRNWTLEEIEELLNDGDEAG